MTTPATLLAFASDLSGGDPTLLATVQAALVNPPRTAEEIGFYPFGDESDLELVVRKTIYLLSEQQVILGVEDKYMVELPSVLEQHIECVTPEISRMFTTDELGDYYDRLAASDADQEILAAIMRRFRDRWVAGARAVEAACEAAGVRLLGVDLPMGDTVHFVVLPPALADKWRDVLLVTDRRGHEIGLSAPLWDVAWSCIIGDFRAEQGDISVTSVFPPRPAKRAL